MEAALRLHPTTCGLLDRMAVVQSIDIVTGTLCTIDLLYDVSVGNGAEVRTVDRALAHNVLHHEFVV